MTIKTTTPYRVTAGMNILKRISDGHYYGIVAGVSAPMNPARPWEGSYIIVFEDGETIKRYGSDAIHYKEA